MTRTRSGFEFGGTTVPPGGRAILDLPISVLPDRTPVHLSTQVIHGRRSGPTMFVSAAIHGDEIVGVEVIRRLLKAKALRRLRGTLLAVPIVNAFGFINQSRYLPDRRDLNRTFPGTRGGSLGGQIAHLFMNAIVTRCDIGIDLHTAAQHRVNLPQIRIAAGRPEVRALADSFGAPIVLESSLREGSLRHAALEAGVDVLVYEAGEALRFDEFAIRAGVTGVMRVMRALEMLPERSVSLPRVAPNHAHSSRWLRAPEGGVLRAYKTIGARVAADEVIAVISDPFGTEETEVRTRDAGIIIGRTNLPVVGQGDALFNIAQVDGASQVERDVDRIASQLQSDPMFDDDDEIL